MAEHVTVNVTELVNTLHFYDDIWDWRFSHTTHYLGETPPPPDRRTLNWSLYIWPRQDRLGDNAPPWFGVNLSHVHVGFLASTTIAPDPRASETAVVQGANVVFRPERLYARIGRDRPRVQGFHPDLHFQPLQGYEDRLGHLYENFPWLSLTTSWANIARAKPGHFSPPLETLNQFREAIEEFLRIIAALWTDLWSIVVPQLLSFEQLIALADALDGDHGDGPDPLCDTPEFAASEYSKEWPAGLPEPDVLLI